MLQLLLTDINTYIIYINLYLINGVKNGTYYGTLK